MMREFEDICFLHTIGSASGERNMKLPSEDGKKNSKSENTAESLDSDNSELSMEESD
jgi:hypothetical protein